MIKEKICCFVRLLTILIIGLTNIESWTQNIPQKPSRQAALDAFNKGSYEEAYQEFGLLLQNYTRDPLYKYYSGVCLVKLGRDPENAIALLQDAVNVPIEIKSVPSDALFYLGRSQQMAGKFPDAIKSFDLFVSRSGKKSARDYNVSQYIEECSQGKGKVSESVAFKTVPIEKQFPAVREERKPVKKEAFREPPVKSATQRENLPVEVDKALTDGLNYQVKADSLTALAVEYKREYERLPASRKPLFKQKITSTEALAAKYQKMADDKLGNNVPVSDGAKITVTGKEGNLLESNQVQKQADRSTKEPGRGKETELTKAGAAAKSPGVISLFEIIKDPALVQSQVIELDPVIPEGLVYRIQIGVFSKPVSPAFFKGISPVEGFRVSSSGMIRYYAGIFRRLADANSALMTLKQLGFKDSFLVAISGGAIVSMERAALLEKEWGNKQLFEGVKSNSGSTPGEITPPTLSFRVEIIRSSKPLKEDVTESYKKMAGNRGYEILSAEDGTSVYLIGKFITFESASEFADLLNRNGYREAKVVAYLGNKEIPVETAKQLFEKVE